MVSKNLRYLDEGVAEFPAKTHKQSGVRSKGRRRLLSSGKRRSRNQGWLPGPKHWRSGSGSESLKLNVCY